MNILLIQLLRLGDAVQIIPIVHGLKEQFPQARIHLLASTLGKSIFEMEPRIDRVFVLRKELIAQHARCGRPSDMAAALEMLQADLAPLFNIPWDWVVNFSFSFPSALVCFLLNAARVSGYTANRQRQYLSKEKWFSHSLASFCHRRYSNFNWVDINKRIIDLAQVPRLPLLDTDPRMENQAGRHLQSIGFQGHNIIAIHPGASNNVKTWPLENFAEFARIMTDQHDYRILILGGKEEVTFGNRLQELLGPKAHDLCGRTTLEQLKAYLKKCRWLVGNDSGPMHLAAAVGIRTLVLFFNSHFVETGVYASGHIALHPDLPCYPCQGPSRCVSKECLKHIKPRTLEKMILFREDGDAAAAFSLETDDSVKAYLSCFDPWGMLEWIPLIREPVCIQALERLVLRTAWLLCDSLPLQEKIQRRYLSQWLARYRPAHDSGTGPAASLEHFTTVLLRFKELLNHASLRVAAMQKALVNPNQNRTRIRRLGQELADIENQLGNVDKQSALVFVNELLAVFRENIEMGDLGQLSAQTGRVYQEIITFTDLLLEQAREIDER